MLYLIWLFSLNSTTLPTALKEKCREWTKWRKKKWNENSLRSFPFIPLPSFHFRLKWMKRNKKERNLVYLFLSLMLLFLSIPTAHLISVLWYSLQLIPLEPFGFKCPKGKNWFVFHSLIHFHSNEKNVV